MSSAYINISDHYKIAVNSFKLDENLDIYSVFESC